MALVDMIIGGLSGAISRTLTAPLELRKIQEQNRFIPDTTFRDVMRKEGIQGLWKGNWTNCIRIAPQMAVNFSVFNIAKNRLFIPLFDVNSTNKGASKDIINFCSGALAGMVAMSSIYPLENIRSRLSLQTNKAEYKNIVDVFKKTPIRHLYYGLNMSLIGFVPYNALNFMFYNKYKSLGQFSSIDKQYVNLICGGLSGLSAVTITYPTDLIRRRLQIQGFSEHVPKYNGIIDCITKIYRTEGISGLYRGLIPCYIKIFPTVAIQFYIIEYLSGLK